MDPRPIFGMIFSLVPERHHARGLVIAKRIGEFVPAWAAATLLGMAAVGLLVFLLMWPIFGFVDALVLGSLENSVILPFVMARGMRLHPVSVIFSTLLCVAAFGLLGVLVAVPLVAIVHIVHDELYRKQFLPTTTDAELERLSLEALDEGRLGAK